MVSFMRLDHIVIYLLMVRMTAIVVLSINGTRRSVTKVWVLVVVTN